jgi:hypothetical protein
MTESGLLNLAEALVREAVRWTARSSFALVCLILMGEGLAWHPSLPVRRATALRGLGLSHTVHALFVAALAVLLGGANLVQRSSPVDVLGGALSYAFIFWGALRPESKVVPWGLVWIWGNFVFSYGVRTLRTPWPWGLFIALLAAAMAVRTIGPLARRPRGATA